jgi:hypothetical protein
LDAVEPAHSQEAQSQPVAPAGAQAAEAQPEAVQERNTRAAPSAAGSSQVDAPAARARLAALPLPYSQKQMEQPARPTGWLAALRRADESVGPKYLLWRKAL